MKYSEAVKIADKVKFKKNEEKTINDRNYYDIFLEGERIGFARRGRERSGYWGAWEGFIYDNDIITDSRKNVVIYGLEEIKIK